MKHYIIRDNHVEFRQSYPMSILRKLFVTLYDLGVPVLDGATRSYPNRVDISESEFLSVLEMIS